MSWESLKITADPNGGIQQKHLCPQCSHTRSKDHEKCLSINIQTGDYNCKHCGWSGSIHSKYTVVEPFGKPLSDDAYEKFFAHRGITKKVVDDLGVTYGMKFMPQTGKKEVAIAYPYNFKGRLSNYKFRDLEKNFRGISGARSCPFNYDNALQRLLNKTTKRLYITEGEPDTICYEMMSKESISVPNGANLNTNNLDWIEDIFDELIKIPKLEICLAVDNDEAGKKLRMDLRDRLVNHFIITYVDFGEFKDANDYFKAKGNLDLTPIELKKPSIFKIKDSLEEIKYFQTHGYPKGKSIMGINKLLTQHRKEFTLMTGIPNHGKTSFTLNWASEHAIMHNEKVGIISLEKSPLITSTRLVEITSRKEITKIGGFEIDLHLDQLNTNVIISRPKTLTEDSLFQEMEYLVGKYGVSLLILDPYSHVRLKQGDDQIADFLIRFSDSAKDLDCHNLMVAHPKKMDKHQGKYVVPKPYDISGSHHFYNVPDNILSFYNNDSEFELHVQKVREHYVGEPGIAYFKGYKESGVFAYMNESTERELNGF
jgi:twinkle protein